MLKLTPTWCGPLTTPGVLNLTPEFLQSHILTYLVFRKASELVPDSLLPHWSSMRFFMRDHCIKHFVVRQQIRDTLLFAFRRDAPTCSCIQLYTYCSSSPTFLKCAPNKTDKKFLILNFGESNQTKPNVAYTRLKWLLVQCTLQHTIIITVDIQYSVLVPIKVKLVQAILTTSSAKKHGCQQSSLRLLLFIWGIQ